MPREAPTTFRMPAELRDWVTADAARSGRSFSAELVWLLERGRAYRDAPPLPVEATAEIRAEVRALAEPEAPVLADLGASGSVSDRQVRPDFKVPAAKKERRR